jgi:hypothetical protein
MATRMPPFRLAVNESDALLKLARFQSAAEMTSPGMGPAGQAGLEASLAAIILTFNACEALLAGGRTADAAALIGPLTTAPPDRDHWIVHQTRAAIDLLRGDTDGTCARHQLIDAIPARLGNLDFARESAQRTYIKPMLIQAAWAAIRVKGRLQARYSRLVRRFGGDKNPGAKKKAIIAIAHTLLKIAYQVLKSGMPYQEPGADSCTRRESPEQKQAWLERQLQRLHPGCTVIITISPPEAALPTRRLTSSPHSSEPRSRYRSRHSGHSAPDNQRHSLSPCHRTGQGSLPRAHRGPSCRVRHRTRIAVVGFRTIAAAHDRDLGLLGPYVR